LVSNDVAIVSGTAPVGVKTIWFNGVEWPLSWSTITNWVVQVPLRPGTNALSVLGVDLHGQPVAGATNSVTAVYDGTVPSPAGQVVINEIMFNPAVPNAGYIELYNNSPSLTFDLSGWQLPEVGYTFPAGSLIGPNSYLVLVANRSAFAGAYGGDIPIFHAFPGTLSVGGQLLTLLQPGNVVVAQLRYGGAPPWPARANGAGSSLQLIDSHQDNWRVGNWAASPPRTRLLLAAPIRWPQRSQAFRLCGSMNCRRTILPASPTQPASTRPGSNCIIPPPMLCL
jgi:hypothetical protein